MKRRHQFRAAVVEHAPAQPRDRIERAQQRLRAELAERDDHLRLDDVDLLEQERLAGLHLVLLRVPVLRRAALYSRPGVDLLPPPPPFPPSPCHPPPPPPPHPP